MSERLHILEQIERGEISAAEGARRLEALAAHGVADAPAAPRMPLLGNSVAQAVFWSGTALLCGGGLALSAVYGWGAVHGWLPAGWALLALGVLAMAVGWALSRAAVVSVRVCGRSGRPLVVTLPLPLGIVAWGLRTARVWVPDSRRDGLDALASALHGALHSGPMMVDVRGRGGGARVEITRV